MNFNAPLSLHQRSQFSEGSKLASTRDTRNNSSLWRKDKKNQDQLHSAVQAMQKTIAQISKQRRKPLGGSKSISLQDAMYPFRIYKPQIANLDLLAGGITFDAEDSLVACTISSASATRLPPASGPYNINPSTDSWRIWAVRSGFVSNRRVDTYVFDAQEWLPGSNGQTQMSDMSMSLEVDGCDQVGEYSGQGVNFDITEEDAANLGQLITPVILPGTPAASPFPDYSFALWIQIDAYNNTAKLMGRQYNGFTGETVAFPPNPDDSTYIPVGALSSIGAVGDYQNQPLNLTPYNIQVGHAIERYGSYVNDLDATSTYLDLNVPLNFRGNWSTDPITTLMFYPGDCVIVQQELDFTASGGIDITITDPLTTDSNSKLFVQNLWCCMAYWQSIDGGGSGESSPDIDPDWFLISGTSLESVTTPTPDTA